MMDMDPGSSGSGSSSQEKRWPRPPAPSLNPLTDSVVFQQIDIDSYIGDPIQGDVYNSI